MPDNVRTRRVVSDPILRRLTSASDEDRQEVVEREVAAAEKRANAEQARQWAGQRARERTPRPDESGRDDPLHNPEAIILGGTEGEAGSEEGRDEGERDIVDPDDLPGDIVTPDKHNSDPDADPEIVEGDEPADNPDTGTHSGLVDHTVVDDGERGPLAGDENDQSDEEPYADTLDVSDDDNGDTDGVLGDDIGYGDDEADATDVTDDSGVDASDYPTGGTSTEVIDWVHADEDRLADRAEYALDQEQARGAGPRKRVTDAVEKLAP